MQKGTNSRKFYLFMIVSYAILIFITIQILTWILYLNFEKSNSQEALASSKKNLTITEYQVESVFESAKVLCKQMFLDNDIKDLMYGATKEQIEISRIVYKLNSYYMVSDFIDSIYIYSRNNKYFYSSNPIYSDNSAFFFDREIYDIIVNKNLRDFMPFFRVLKSRASGVPEEKKVYTLVLKNSFNNTKEANGAVIINIKADWITGKLKSLEERGSSQSVLIDSNGMIAGSSEVENLSRSISTFPFAEEIMTPWQKSGSFEKKINGVNYLVSYSYSKDLNWKTVRMVKYDLIFEKIRSMRNTTLLVSFIILISALFATFLLSRNIYNPINKLIEKNVSLESMRRENYAALRQEILKSLMSRTINPEILSKNFKEFEIGLDLAGKFLIILLKIDKFVQFFEANDAENRKLMQFAVGNIAHEIISSKFANEVIENGEDFVTVLISCNNMSGSDLHGNLATLLNEVKASVGKYLKLSVSCIVSNLITSINEINNEFSNTRELSNYRLVYGHSCTIVIPELLKRLNQGEFTYPVRKEKQLLDSLMLGSNEKALSIYRDMLESVRNYPYNDLMAFLTRLALSLNTMVAQLKSSLNRNVEFDFYSFSKMLNSLETLKDINRAFESLFEEICDSLAYDKEDKLSPFAQAILEYIDLNYQNLNLSLNEVAGHFGKAPLNLGRAFKKITSKSVSDYINEVRLKKSKELLSSTAMTIEDICNKVGIINANYFYMFFKKHTGVTPNEYRRLKPS